MSFEDKNTTTFGGGPLASDKPIIDPNPRPVPLPSEIKERLEALEAKTKKLNKNGNVSSDPLAQDSAAESDADLMRKKEVELLTGVDDIHIERAANNKKRIKDGFEGKHYLYNPAQYATAEELTTAVELLAGAGGRTIMIMDSIDGQGETWNLPENTRITFGGGMLSNVELSGDNCWLYSADYQVIGTVVSFTGSWKANEVNPYMFGAVGGYDYVNNIGTDDYTALQKMLDFAILANGDGLTNIKTIGDTFGTSEVLWGHSFNWKGSGTKIVAANNSCRTLLIISPAIELLENNYGLSHSGMSLDESILIKDAVHGDNYTVVQDGSKFKKGNIVLLKSEQNLTDGIGVSATTRRRGEIKEVKFVRGNDVSFTDPIFENGYDSSVSGGNASLVLLDSKSAELRGIEFIGDGDNIPVGEWYFQFMGHIGNGILIASMKNVILDDIKFRDFISVACGLIYNFNVKIQNLFISGSTGMGRAGNPGFNGYAIELYNANSHITIDNYLSFNSRHAYDNAVVAWLYGRQWNVNLTNNTYTGNNLFTSQGVFAPHEGCGSITLTNVKVLGLRGGRENWSVTPVAGAVREYSDPGTTNYIRRYYISLTGVNNDPPTNPTDWELIDSPNAILDEAWIIDETYEFSDIRIDSGISYACIQAHTSSGAAPILTSDINYWSEVTKGGVAGFVFRPEIRSVVINNCEVSRCSSAFLIWPDIDNFKFNSAIVEDCGAVFANASANQFTINKLSAKNTSLFAWLDSSTEFNADNVIFNDGMFTNVRYGAYTTNTMLDGVRAMIFNNCSFSDKKMFYNERSLKDIGCKFKRQTTSSIFDRFEFNNCYQKNNGYFIPYIEETVSGGSKKYSVYINGLVHEYIGNFPKSFPFGLLNNVNVFSIKNSIIDNKPLGYVSGYQLFESQLGIWSIDKLELLNNSFHLLGGTVKTSGINVVKFIHDNNEFTSASMTDVDADYEILSGDSTRKGEQIVDFTSLEWTTPELNIPSYKGTILKDKDTGIVFEKLTSGYGSTGYGVVQGQIAEITATTNQNLDCRTTTTFRRNFVSATEFTLKLKGYAVGQKVEGKIWLPASAIIEANIADPIFVADSGDTLNVFMKGHAYIVNEPTVIDFSAIITAVSSGNITASVTYTLTSITQ